MSLSADDTLFIDTTVTPKLCHFQRKGEKTTRLRPKDGSVADPSGRTATFQTPMVTGVVAEVADQEGGGVTNTLGQGLVGGFQTAGGAVAERMALTDTRMSALKLGNQL
jgi:hypothetical protein